jgi:5-methylcytosine-specific restriction endonuclease McrA
MKRFRISKKKNWKRAELEELRSLVDNKTNEELCLYFNVSKETLANTMQKHQIKRSEEILKQVRVEAMAGENNPNWKGGISKDGARYSALQRQRYPERKHARDAVYRALKTGELVKPLKCQDCGKVAYLEGHHESYASTHWLIVVWLCKPCHNIRDKELLETTTDKIAYVALPQDSTLKSG